MNILKRSAFKTDLNFITCISKCHFKGKTIQSVFALFKNYFADTTRKVVWSTRLHIWARHFLVVVASLLPQTLHWVLSLFCVLLYPILVKRIGLSTDLECQKQRGNFLLIAVFYCLIMYIHVYIYLWHLWCLV